MRSRRVKAPSLQVAGLMATSPNSLRRTSSGWALSTLIRTIFWNLAHRVFKEALTIRIKLLGEKHDLTGDARRELANVDLRSRLTPAEHQELIEADYETQTAADRIAPDVNALKAAKRFFEIRRLLLGSEHPLVASSLNVLGKIEKESGQFRQAESDLKRALTIRQKHLENDHSQTLQTKVNMAFLYEDWGGAIPSIRSDLPTSARSASDRLLGDDHYLTGDAYSGLGFSYMLMGDFAKGRQARDRRGRWKFCKRPGEKSTLSPVRPPSIWVGSTIALTTTPRPNLFSREFLAIEQRVRPGGFQAARAMDGLADCCLKRRDFARAEQIVRDSLAIKRQILGDGHPDVHVTLHLLGQVYFSEGRYVEARDTLEQTLKFAREALGNDHIFVANLLCMLGKVAHRHERRRSRDPMVYGRIGSHQ